MVVIDPSSEIYLGSATLCLYEEAQVNSWYSNQHLICCYRAKSYYPFSLSPITNQRLTSQYVHGIRFWLQLEGGDSGWDSCMASSTQWTWVCINSKRWWRTEKPAVLQFVGSPRVRHDCITEQQQQQNFILPTKSFVAEEINTPRFKTAFWHNRKITKGCKFRRQ